MVEQRSPKPRVLGSSPSTPGCEIPRKPFRHWLPGDFPCVQILGLSVMVLPFFARFALVFHRRNIKNAPRVLAEGGKGVVTVRLAGTCGGRSSGTEGNFWSAGNGQGVLRNRRKRKLTGRPRASFMKIRHYSFEVEFVGIKQTTSGITLTSKPRECANLARAEDLSV